MMFWCIAMSNIEIGADDVIELERENVNALTLLTGQMLQTHLREVGKALIAWIHLDSEKPLIRCRYLSPAGGGWQKGRVRLSMEFIPDEPEPQKEDPLNEWEQGGR